MAGPVPSPGGSMIAFASNWAQDCGGGCGSASVIKDCVVMTAASAAVAGAADGPLPVTVPSLARARLAESLEPAAATRQGIVSVGRRGAVTYPRDSARSRSLSASCVRVPADIT